VDHKAQVDSALDQAYGRERQEQVRILDACPRQMSGERHVAASTGSRMSRAPELGARTFVLDEMQASRFDLTS
jgi:hypothetical protein